MRRAVAVFCWLGALAGALGSPGQLAAQPATDVVLSMRADRTELEAGGIFRLTIEAQLTGTANVQLRLPELREFDVIAQRRSTPFALRMGFGGAAQRVQSTTRHEYTLRARQTGEIHIPPAVVDIGPQHYESNALTITVSGAPGDTANANGALPPSASLDGMRFDPNGFLRTWVDEGEPYIGQQVTVSIYLYVPGRLRSSPVFTQEPTTDGFWVQNLLEASMELVPRSQVFQNRRFEVYMLRRFAAFPLQAGELTIGEPQLSIPQGRGWAVLGGPGPTAQEIVGAPLTIRVRELPDAGRPRGDAHVGTLTLAAAVDRSQVATGDAVTLTVTATGRGALQQLRLQDPQAPGLRVLAPEVHDMLTHEDQVVQGTRTVRWLVVPERPGTYSLGPFSVPVFDPSTQRWSVASAAAIELIAAGNAIPDPAEAETAEETRPHPPDAADAVTFGPVHTESAFARTHGSFTSSSWFLGLLGLGPLLLLLGLGVRTARRRAASVDATRAPKRAQRQAKRRLAAARAHAEADAPREFYTSVAKALKDVLEAKLGRAVGSLTHAELREVLSTRGMDDALASEIVDELEGCDFARFSAVGVSATEMDRCLSRARALLGQLDRFTPSAEEAR